MNISSEEINFISSITELQVWNMELWKLYAIFRPLFLITTKVRALGQKYSRRRHSWKLFIFIVIILISSAMQNYHLSESGEICHLEIITWTVLIAVRLHSEWRDWRKSLFRLHVNFSVPSNSDTGSAKFKPSQNQLVISNNKIKLNGF